MTASLESKSYDDFLDFVGNTMSIKTDMSESLFPSGVYTYEYYAGLSPMTDEEIEDDANKLSVDLTLIGCKIETMPTMTSTIPSNTIIYDPSLGAVSTISGDARLKVVFNGLTSNCSTYIRDVVMQDTQEPIDSQIFVFKIEATVGQGDELGFYTNDETKVGVYKLQYRVYLADPLAAEVIDFEVEFKQNCPTSLTYQGDG